ncbi:transcription factor A, mitochondrial isoform X2 [Phymastichus coffea]|uniref:transcription factor A, mitochondrial isoform X2 n=1 Tax=Phymastichus coffea TaxID=108790 RepID=UPI00273C7F98|nr:transcription factor A, mitochondrial isoform X2 [Phymastichus coffea]
MTVLRLFNFRSFNASNCRNLLTSNVLKGKFLEKIGVPLPPKKPLNPYIKFVKELRPKVVQNQPDLKATDIVKVMAEEWRNCDPELKKSYQKKFLLEMQDYLAALEKYNNSISKEQRDLIDAAKVKQKKHLEQTKILAKQEELGKPKKPFSPFLGYLEEKKAYWKDGNYQAFLKEMSQEWKNMSDDLKQKYVMKTKAQMDKYKEEIMKWEERMIREGHLDVVRSKNILGKKSKKTPKVVEQ